MCGLVPSFQHFSITGSLYHLALKPFSQVIMLLLLVYIKCFNYIPDKAQYSRDRHVVMTRYAVYGGLTIATCIIFQNNQKVAFGVGLAVALYIAASEHFISQSSQNAGPKLPLADSSM